MPHMNSCYIFSYCPQQKQPVSLFSNKENTVFIQEYPLQIMLFFAQNEGISKGPIY